MGARAGLDVFQKRQIFCPCWDSNPRSLSPWPSCYTVYAIPVSRVNPFKYMKQYVRGSLTLSGSEFCPQTLFRRIFKNTQRLYKQ